MHKRIFYPILFILLILFYFSDVLLTGRIFAERDLPVFFYQYLQFWRRSASLGEFTLWNPFIMCGEPFLAALQPAQVYPLSFIYYLFSVDTAFNITIILHFFLSGVFTFILVKELKGSDSAAIIASLSFCFGGYLLSVHNVLSTLLSVTWFPLLLACFHRSLILSSIRYSIYSGIFLGTIFAGGGIEVFFISVLFMSFLILFPYLELEITLPPFKKRLFHLFISLFFFLFLMAIEWIPFFELILNSVRSEGLQFEESILWSLAPKNLLYLLIPDIFYRGPDYYWEDQSWLKTIYVGIIPFALLIFFIKEKSKRKIFIVSVMILSILLSLGKYTPFYKFLYNYIPFFNLIRYPVKYLFIFIFFLSLAAGFGWDYLATHLQEFSTGRKPKYFLWMSFLLTLLFALTFLFEKTILSFFSKENWILENSIGITAVLHNLKRVIFYTILTSLWIFLLLKNSLRQIIGAKGLIIILIADLCLGNLGYYVTVEKATLHNNETPELKFLLQDKDLYRIYVDRRLYKNSHFSYRNPDEYLTLNKRLLVPNLLMERKLYDVNGFSVLTLKNYYKILILLLTSPQPDSTRLPDLLNIKYLLWSEPLKSNNFELVRKDTFYLYRNKNLLPRAFLVEDYRVVSEEMEIKNVLQDKDFNPLQRVLFDKNPSKDYLRNKPILSKRIREQVKISEYRNEFIKIEATLSSPKILVLSETYYPGWKAYLDGKVTEIYRANFAFRAVILPPGTHNVTFVFDPFTVKTGRALTLFTLFIFIFLSISYRVRKLKDDKIKKG